MKLCSSLITSQNVGLLKSCCLPAVGSFNSRRTLKRWPETPDLRDVEMPVNRKLPILDPVPQGIKAIKSQRRLYDMQGPELVHNQLIYKQYGIIALCGGQLHPGHLNMIRQVINKGLDIQRMFAVWRIDPPWKAITSKGVGKRMGGGKGNIKHYVTPVKAGRVLVEVGGRIEFEEVYFFLQDVAWKLPIDAMVINQHTLEELKKEEEEIKAKNVNPFTFEYVVKNNMRGCKKWTSPYDEIWYGKYI